MFERLKRVLVDSYMASIALGWLLAQDIVHFVGIFTAPLSAWVSQNNYRALAQKSSGAGEFPFQAAFPELARAVLIFIVWYALLHWLYMRPVRINSSKPFPVATPPVSGN